ncbi:transposase [Spirosoma pollinicola]|uniref:transposase n=1 Tax=Spirosoma pollinicola TaxID=2057025 RepID=UPI00197FCA1D|nr:transposase [Spirosoma pollinicola]
MHEPTLPPAQKELRYSSRQLSRLLGQPEVDWPETDRPFLEYLLNCNESITQVHRLSLHFRLLMQTKQANELAGWCADAEKLPILSGFVRGMRQDFAAVEEAFRSEWSNGQTEGQVNRLKTIKRQMYGKANFDLLRLRVLARHWTVPPK